MEISDFLKNNKILIFFNKDNLIDLNIVQSKDIHYIFEKFLFISSDGRFISNEEAKKITIDGKAIDIELIYNEILKLKKEWEKLNVTKYFPDIMFDSSSFSTRLLFYDNKHKIIISSNDLKSMNRFRFVLGHELGHIYFNLKHRSKFDDNYLNKLFFPKEHFFIFFINLIISVYLFFIKDPSLFLFILLSFFPFIFFIINFLSRKDRILSFSMEYFSDFFSNKINKNSLIFDDLLPNTIGHSYTHPCNRWRIYMLKKSLNNDLISWKNPLYQYYIGHRMLNIYEFSYFIKITFSKVCFLIKKFIDFIKKQW